MVERRRGSVIAISSGLWYAQEQEYRDRLSWMGVPTWESLTPTSLHRVLRNDGFRTSANPIVTLTGLGSLLMAPFGSHAFNIAAITAAICTGKEAHEQPSRRWIAGVAAGVFYFLVGVFGQKLSSEALAQLGTGEEAQQREAQHRQNDCENHRCQPEFQITPPAILTFEYKPK